MHARSVFNKKYENNVIEWTGYYVETKQVQSWALFKTDIVDQLMIKMSPSESILHPDLVLSLPYSVKRENQEMLETLKKGHELRFKAVMVAIGNEFKMHHLKAVSITKTGYIRELSGLYVRDNSLPL